MRLLLIIDHFGLGGAQRQMASLAAGLSGRGHEVHAFVYHPRHRHFRPGLEAGGVTFHEVEKSSRFSLAPVAALRRLLRGGDFDAAVAFLGTPAVYAELASLGADAPPLIVSERSPGPDRPGRGTRWRYELHAMATLVTVPSRSQMERLAEDVPWLRPKLRYVHNGVDLARFRPAPGRLVDPPNGTATNGNGRPATLRLLALGNTAPGKNASRLAEALALHHRLHGPRIRITWAGRPPASPAERAGRDAAREALRTAGVERYWHWHPAVAEPEALLARHDALIHPSMWEGLSNAVCEALACGRPVLAGDISDHGTLVGDGARGFLFDPKEPGQISEAMERMRAIGVAGRTDMGVRARRHAENHLDIEDVLTSWERLLAGVARARPRLAIVGSFPAPSSVVYGGTRTACDALLDSSLPERVELAVLDSTQVTVPAPSFLRRLGRALARVPRFVWMMEARPPRAVLLFATGGWGFAEKALYAAYARARGVPAVLFPRHGGLMDRCRRSWAKRLVVRAMVRAPSRVACQGRVWMDFFTAVMGLPPERCPVLPNWTATEGLLGIGRARDYRPDRPVTLLFMGCLEVEKGVEELLRAFRQLMEESDPGAVRLLIAGEGSASAAARRLASELGIAGAVDFLGWLTGRPKERVFQAADIFVLPSWSEGMPNAVIEAMAAGLPAVVSRVGSVPDAVTDGIDGCLVPPGDVAALAVALRRLVDDPAERLRLGRAARVTAGERYCVEPAVDRLGALLAELGASPATTEGAPGAPSPAVP